MRVFKTLLCFALPAAISASPPCYWPDGTLANEYTSCGEDFSHCCHNASVCMTNGYCISVVDAMSMSRATCKDRTWRSCENPCATVPGRQMSGCSLILYGKTEAGNAVYCPNAIVANSSTTTGCDDGSEPFTIPNGNIVTNKAAFENASCAVDPINPELAAPPAGATKLKDSAGNINNDNNNNNNTSCSANGNSNENSNSGSGASSSRGTAIGAGVGVPLGTIALAGVGWALFERKKRYQLLNSPQQPLMMMMPSDPAATPKSELPGFNQAPQELEGDRFK